MPRRAVLVGQAHEPAVRRVADELRAAAFEVLIVPESAATQAADVARLARRHHAVAAIVISEGAHQVAIHVADDARGESMVRYLGSKPAATAGDGVQALRVVEVLNAALLDLEREASPLSPQAQSPAPDRPTAAARAAPSGRGLRLAARADGQLLWFSGGLSPFLGPELGLRLELSSGFFFHAAGFVSASGAAVAAPSGSAEVNVFSAAFGAGWSVPLPRHFALRLSLGAGPLAAWAGAAAAPGYRVRSDSLLSALVSLGVALDYRLSRGLLVGAVGGVGRVLPESTIALSGLAVAQLGPWSATAGVGLSLELAP